jgi:hypothetical protein
MAVNRILAISFVRDMHISMRAEKPEIFAILDLDNRVRRRRAILLLLAGVDT